MLNADDQFTPISLYRLKETIRETRPLVLWVGAGASRWAGLPSWHELARQMRRTFARAVTRFPIEVATSHLAMGEYPELFQLCKDADSRLFNKTLLEQVGSSASGPVYVQFIERLRELNPIQVITTNVDLSLEQSLGPIDVIERSDFERCGDAIVRRLPFVAKLHGSISAVNFTVFTTDDYRALIANIEFIDTLRTVFCTSTVVFLGYGLQDDYLLELIKKAYGDSPLFGIGPHFLMTNTAGPVENGVFRIGYNIARHPDHRAALTILDFIRQARSRSFVEPAPIPRIADDSNRRESGFYISDFKPSGTHLSGQTLDLARPDGSDPIKALVGLGFVESELSNTATVAFHDLTVGLVCFDRVYLPLAVLGLLHERVTAEVFWPLVDEGAIRFIDVIHEPFYVAAPESLLGDIGVARLQDPETMETRSAMHVIRRMLRPAPGHESEGEKKIEELGPRVISFSQSEVLGLPQMVRDALLLPKVSRLLGYAEYIVPSGIPRWLAHPTIRLGHLVQTGLMCNELGIRACRVPFGGNCLLGAAFNVKPAEQSLYDYANFIVSGASGSNVSEYIERKPKILLDLLRFRDSSEGRSLRQEVVDRLEVNEGTEFAVAIEGGLKRAIPASVIQAARNKFSMLMKADNSSASASALWGDSNLDDGSLRLWRTRSRQLLLEHAKQRGVKSHAPCLCGSGDPMRDCCLKALN